MSKQLKLRRGTTAQHSTFTGAEGEVTVDTTKDTLVVHDGTTAGGKPLLTEANPSYTGTLTGGTGVVNLGSGQFYKNASGNVGIGTSSPNGRLQVTGGTTNASNLATAYSAAAFTLVPKSTSGFSLAFGSGPSDFPYIQMSAAGSVASDMALQPYGGNVGIGTSSPSGYGKLSVNGNVILGPYTRNQAGTQYIGIATAGDPAADDRASINFTTVAGASSSNSFITFSTNNYGVSGGERMRIDSSGNLGIGTSSPNEKLMVAGAIRSTSNAINWAASDGAVMDYNAGEMRLVAARSGSNSSVMSFTTYNTGTAAERARIDSSGTLLVGQTTNPATSTMVIKVPTGSANGVNAQITSNTGTSYPWSNYNASGTYVGGISCTSTGTAFPTSSDYRLKEDVQPMTGALAKVAALKPCTYKWKLNGSDGQGFIAHELAEVVPDAVVGEKDATEIQQYEISPAVPATFDEEGNELTPAVEAVMGEREVPVYQGIDTSFLVATLTAAIQEQQAIITALTARVEALEQGGV